MRAARRSIEEQYQLVLECRQSGMSDYLWCAQHDIKVGTFYSWVQNLRRTGSYEIPTPAGRENYKPMEKQEVVRVDFSSEPVVSIPHPNIIKNQTIDSTYHMKLDIGEVSLHISNEVEPLLLAKILQLLHGSK